MTLVTDDNIAIPIETIKAVEPKPGSILFIETHDRLPATTVERMQKQISDLSGMRVIVVEGVKISKAAETGEKKTVLTVSEAELRDRLQYEKIWKVFRQKLLEMAATGSGASPFGPLLVQMDAIEMEYRLGKR